MNRITDYVNSIIPDNIPKKKKQQLYDELLSHAYDRKDYYTEIGFDENTSTEKALADMGEGETVKNSIRVNFEELYVERTWWAFAAAAVVLAMNILCFFTGMWVMSADFNDEPTAFTAFVSFMMIFVMLFEIAFARVKKYRKTLVGIGIANVLVAGNFLMCFYPQSAFYVLDLNIICLLERFTPLYMNDFLEYYVGGMFYISCIVFLALCSMYCFVMAVLIKKGRAETVKSAKMKLFVFTAVYFAVAVASSAIYPWSEAYEQNYPMWFSEYISGICEETSELYDNINLLDDYNTAAEYLTASGWVSTAAYEKTLDKVTLKQFRGEIRRFGFVEGYEVWFTPDESKNIKGNGFIALQKSVDNKITGKRVGNINADMYSSNSGFGYSRVDYVRDDMQELMSAFDNLKKGDREEDVLAVFGSDKGVVYQYGEFYTKAAFIENGNVKTYYRLYSYGTVYPEEKSYYDRVKSRCYEFTFENGLLTQGNMYYSDSVDGLVCRSVK